jgi:hypothetical protein
MSAPRNLNAAANEKRRKRELKKCLKSTYYLAKNYLDYDLLEEWHEVRCNFFDSHRDDRYMLWLAPRGHFKTTLVEAEVIRDILTDPNKTHLLTHASAEEVQKNVHAIAHHFTHNKKLRWLMPEIMPKFADDNFFKVTPSPHFTVKREKYDKQPTVRGAQAGKEITGSHINGVIWLDDIVGEKTLKDSTGMADLRHWYENTILNVLMKGGRIRARGTRWHLDDIWNDFLHKPGWICMTDAALVDEDGNPDWKGTPPVKGLADDVMDKLANMTHRNFAMQMMNNPLTEEMRAWNMEDETFCELADVPSGVNMVLSDPAPKGVGAVDKEAQKRRGGEGDYWGIAVVRFVVKKNRLYRYVLETVRCRTWTWEEGINACLDMCEKWGTRWLCVEEGSQTKGMHQKVVKEESRKRGLPSIKFIEMKSFSKGKNWRHAQLASLNTAGDLIFVTDVHDEGTHKLLMQECRDHPQSRFDDLMDSVSLCTDPAVIERAPKAEKFVSRMKSKASKAWKKRTRYVY